MTSTALVSTFNVDQKELYASMPKAWQAKADEALKLRSDLIEASILARHKLGEIVRDMVGDERRYGEGAVQSLATVMGFERPNILWECRRFATLYTAKQLGELLTKANKSGRPLTWSHIELLCSIDKDAKKRHELETQTINKVWTVKELRMHVSKLLSRRGNSPGRSPSVPKTPTAGLAQLSQLSSSYLNRFPAWEESIVTELESAGVDQMDEEILKQLDESRDKLLEVKERTDMMLLSIEGVRTRVDEALQAKGDDDDDEDEDDEDVEEEDTDFDDEVEEDDEPADDFEDEDVDDEDADEEEEEEEEDEDYEEEAESKAKPVARKRAKAAT